MPLSFRPGNIQSNDDSLCIGQIPDDLAYRDWQAANQRGDGKDLVIPGQRGVLCQIDYLEVILFFVIFRANLVQIGNSSKRSWRLARDVESKFNEAASI